MPDTPIRPRLRPAKLATTLQPDPASGTAAASATTPAQFDPTAPILLGTFGSKEKRGAILRLPNGRTEKVRVGDALAGERVLAVAEDFVVVAHRGETRRFTFPGA